MTWRPVVVKFIAENTVTFNGTNGNIVLVFNYDFFNQTHVRQQLSNYLEMYDQYKILRSDTSLMLETASEYTTKNTDIVRVMRVYDPDSNGRTIAAKEMMKMANVRHFLMRPFRSYNFRLRPRFKVLAPEGDLSLIHI